jgi:hypothetical protein
VRFAYVAVLSFILLSGYSNPQKTSSAIPEAAAQTAAKGELSPEQIIQKFSQKESEFYDAWMQYTYTETATIRIISVDGAPSRESLVIVSEVVFNDDGSREVRILRRSGRLRSVEWTDEDYEVINNINPFALTAKDLPLYNLKYRGKERVDELDCYVFSVSPKSPQKGRLYFDGKIWVDDQDLQVVRTIGKPVPQTRNMQFPEFETIRQVIDDKYWFPVWTHADSKLNFPTATVRIEQTVTYEDYKKFGSKATIQYESPGPKPEK